MPVENGLLKLKGNKLNHDLRKESQKVNECFTQFSLKALRIL